MEYRHACLSDINVRQTILAQPASVN